MKEKLRPQRLTLAMTIAAAVVVIAAWLSRPAAQPKDRPAGPAAKGAGAASSAPNIEEELKQIRALLPGQAHVMRDVGFHAAGLWRAAEHRNWPLAQFYYDEMRSHLRWAVRVRPVRKLSTGQEVSMTNILDSLEGEGGPLALVKQEVERKDLPRFQAAYRTMLEGCYACHKASEKSFLRPKVPTSMADIINFDPAAKWPP
jgi:hypothetical protein